MCGICGFIEKNDCTRNRPPKEEILEQMMSALAHRGPDQGKSWLSDHAALGFRRLAIIDPGGSTQPMVNETKDKVLVFNGEIYNYQALRLELLSAGHRFSTHWVLNIPLSLAACTLITSCVDMEQTTIMFRFCFML